MVPTLKRGTRRFVGRKLEGKINEKARETAVGWGLKATPVLTSRDIIIRQLPKKETKRQQERKQSHHGWGEGKKQEITFERPGQPRGQKQSNPSGQGWMIWWAGRGPVWKEGQGHI